jgi:hypothetical protein
VRARNIKPAFFKNDALAELGFGERLLFIGLWCMADREGRLEYRPKKIKMELFPADNVDIEAGLDDLARQGFVLIYDANGQRYIQIVNFKKHQRPHRNEVESTIPAPTAEGSTTKVESETDQGSKSDEPRNVSLRPDTGYRIPDVLIPDTQKNAADAAPDKPARGRRAPPDDAPFAIWQAGIEALGRDEQEAAPTKGKQLPAIKRMLLRQYSRDDILTCLLWLTDDAFEHQRGVDFIRVDERIDSWALKGKPPPKRRSLRQAENGYDPTLHEQVTTPEGHVFYRNR